MFGMTNHRGTLSVYVIFFFHSFFFGGGGGAAGTSVGGKVLFIFGKGDWGSSRVTDIHVAF